MSDYEIGKWYWIINPQEGDGGMPIKIKNEKSFICDGEEFAIKNLESLWVKDLAPPIQTIIQKLESQLAEAREANRWIPVSERLPEDGQKVFAYNGKEAVAAKYSATLQKFMTADFSVDNLSETSHWKPITKPE